MTFLADQGIEVEMGIGGDAVDLETESLRDRLPSRKAFDDQGGIGQGGLQFEQPGVLCERRPSRRVSIMT